MSNSATNGSNMSVIDISSNMNSNPIRQPLDFSNRTNTVNAYDESRTCKNIYVPEKVNRNKNDKIVYAALSDDFQNKLNNIIRQQDVTAPILCELQQTLKNIAYKYDYDAASCSDAGSDSAISSLDMELLPQTPEKSNSPPVPGHFQLNNYNQWQQMPNNLYMLQVPDNNDSTGDEADREEDEEEEEEENDEDEEFFMPHKQARLEYDPQYPKVFWFDQKPLVMIGPNGTFICAHEFDAMQWNSAAIATRCLLNVIFTNDELATHTLSGKPSPAFHGRERPTKMQLDPLKVADIIHCVVVKTGGKERDVRATITTKCADSAKLYKKRCDRHLGI